MGVVVSGLSRHPEKVRAERQTWYFTFGVGQPNAGRYVVVRDATYGDARDVMHAKFGREWGFQYNEDDWHKGGVSQAEKYGLDLLYETEDRWVESESHRQNQAAISQQVPRGVNGGSE
jgi:hypothetical protein